MIWKSAKQHIMSHPKHTRALKFHPYSQGLTKSTFQTEPDTKMLKGSCLSHILSYPKQYKSCWRSIYILKILHKSSCTHIMPDHKQHKWMFDSPSSLPRSYINHILDRTRRVTDVRTGNRTMEGAWHACEGEGWSDGIHDVRRKWKSPLPLISISCPLLITLNASRSEQLANTFETFAKEKRF